MLTANLFSVKEKEDGRYLQSLILPKTAQQRIKCSFLLKIIFLARKLTVWHTYHPAQSMHKVQTEKEDCRRAVTSQFKEMLFFVHSWCLWQGLGVSYRKGNMEPEQFIMIILHFNRFLWYDLSWPRLYNLYNSIRPYSDDYIPCQANASLKIKNVNVV